MIKDIAIAILAGIATAQRLTQPGDPARIAMALTTAVITFMILLELEDLWDKRTQIRQQTHAIASTVLRGIRQILRDIRSRIRWTWLCLRTYPAELAQRRRRRQMMQDYIQRLRELPLEERAKNPEESEV